MHRSRFNPSAFTTVTLLAAILGSAVGIGAHATSDAQAAVAPAGQGFNLNAGDMRFILKQIKIAENHATTESPEGTPVEGQPLVGSGPNQIPDPMLPFGLRTVDGSENNLQPGQAKFGAADERFPRLTKPVFKDAEPITPEFPVGAPGPTSYTQKRGAVVDSQPRVASNLIVDQTSSNPAAVKAAGKPHRTFLGEPVVPCPAPSEPQPEGCTPEGKTLPMPNVTTDVGLSPPYNSWFTIFGQFFDHGIDSTTKGGSGTVFVPLKADDPLIAGADRQFDTADDLPAQQRFMVLTRAKNQPGADGVMGTADDVQDATNTDSSWVDQSQTYTSHSSHQVFVREYEMNAAGRPVSSGRMLKGDDGGMAPWSKVKAEAAAKLGIKLVDADVLNIPLLATDQYGRFLRGPARGMPQIVTADGLVEGNPADGGLAVPGNARRIGTAFLDDIAHNAVPKQATPQQGPTPPKPALTPDEDTTITGPTGTQPAGTYDDEMLDAHFIAGDGRVNENIALTAVHQIFHSEHNRLVDHMEKLIEDKQIDVAEWKLADGSWNGERIFQAARFVNEMEYQHMVFEEFARKVQPGIDPFAPGAPAQTDLDPAIKAEFAHAVYRFGHSMLTDTVARTNPNGSKNDIELLDAFLNPPAYTKNGAGPKMTPEEAAGSIVQGMTDQAGNELDEFVGETLRSNLLGLPLDLATLNMTRARETGVPSLNGLRKQLHASTNDASLKPYTDWVDFGLSIKHPDSLVNFMAAYGQHPTIKAATTLKDKRIAAQLIHDNSTANPAPADSADFMNSTGEWASKPSGLDDVDLWVGGLAESQNLFGGLLGSTFNYVFEQQLTDLQNGDRMYYLSRTQGLNLRTQLEGNSFAELTMRNTDAQALKADVFSTADCEFELKNLQGTTAGSIADDPASECDENALLVRMADGTIRYRTQNSVDPAGLNAQSTFNGTPGDDKAHGGVDNDTFWGGLGKDRFEGNDGGDVAFGGDGNDIFTDSAGDDNLKGGDGNDAIASGPGLDLIQSGFGSDFVDGGLNSNTVFAGEDDDHIISGNGADTVEGGGGDDWIEGGNGNDLLQGDSGAPFFDDNNAPGGDVISGDGGDDDYDAEGGDDIMLAGPGIERNAGTLGFDWVTHARDPQAAEADLDLRFVFAPAPVMATRDRFQQVEGLSGGKLDDTLRGDSIVPLAGDDLTTAGTAKIAGLQELLGGATTFAAGNIILGGAGSDVIEGRGANDLIDGDRWLNVQLQAPDLATADPGDTKLVDSMTELRADVFAGKLDPGDIKIVRKVEATEPGTSIDTAVFSDVRANYDIIPSVDPTEVTVVHARGRLTDGNDTIKNVERLRFADETVDVAAAPANTAATGTVDISDITPAEGQLLTTTPAFTDADGINEATIAYTWETEVRNDQWEAVGSGATFTPAGVHAGARLRVVARFEDNKGVREIVTSAATAAVTPGPGTVVAPDVPGGGGGGAIGGRQNRGGRAAAVVVPATVFAGALTPITVAATVPEGATVVQINVIQLTGANTVQAARKTARGRKLIATVYRKAPKAKRYTFRLTERKLRRLRPGRYLIEVRVGKSRAELGPATVRRLTVKPSKKTTRR